MRGEDKDGKRLVAGGGWCAQDKECECEGREFVLGAEQFT